METSKPYIGRLSMDESQRAAIRNIKSKVIAMLEERGAIGHTQPLVATPSACWSDPCSFFDYMIGLPEEYFSRLRLHTYHFTGDGYQTYYWTSAKQELLHAWRSLTRQTPNHCVLSEPEGGMGFVVGEGRIVSRDLLRFQRVVNTLYEQSVLAQLTNSVDRRKLVLEIGAGYGGLAHHLARLLGDVTYVIVDLPETLLFAGSYLTLVSPQKRIYMYGPEDLTGVVRSDLSAYDFLLIPNYRLDALCDLRFDLVVNVASFQEMRQEQVATYLDFVAHTSIGTLYSLNQDAHPINRELRSVSDMLRARFEVTEVPLERSTTARIGKHMLGAVKRAAIAAGLMPKSRARVPYRQYLCRVRARVPAVRA